MVCTVFGLLTGGAGGGTGITMFAGGNVANFITAGWGGTGKSGGAGAGSAKARAMIVSALMMTCEVA